MTHRSHAPAISAETNTHITHSDFVEPEAPALTIPREVSGPRRKRVRDLLKQNTFLTQAHVPAAIRLAELEEKYHELKAIVDAEGLVIEDRFGAKKKHPAVELMLQFQTGIVRQEHALAISIPSRKEMISKREEKMRRGGPQPGTRKNQDGTTSPKLRLA